MVILRAPVSAFDEFHSIMPDSHAGCHLASSLKSEWETPMVDWAARAKELAILRCEGHAKRQPRNVSDARWQSGRGYRAWLFVGASNIPFAYFSRFDGVLFTNLTDLPI